MLIGETIKICKQKQMTAEKRMLFMYFEEKLPNYLVWSYQIEMGKLCKLPKKERFALLQKYERKRFYYFHHHSLLS